MAGLFADFGVRVPILAVWALVLLLIAAAGGLMTSLGSAWNRQLFPKPLMHGHVLIAVVGFILLIIGTVG